MYMYYGKSDLALSIQVKWVQEVTILRIWMLASGREMLVALKERYTHRNIVERNMDTLWCHVEVNYMQDYTWINEPPYLILQRIVIGFLIGN